MAEERSRTFAWTLLFLLAAPVLCLQGCGDPDGHSSPLSAESKYLGEVGVKLYREAEAPQEAPLLRWDFSKPVIHAYDYTQKMAATMDFDMGDGKSPEANTDITAGTLLIKSKGNRAATLVMKDMKATSKMRPGEEKQTMKFPAVVVQGVKENGSMKTGSSSEGLLLRFMFPLPPKPLRVGESVAVPASIPFYAMGSVLSVEGVFTITLMKYVTIDGRRCARLDTSIDVSELDVSEDLVGTYKCSVKGRSVSYFDIERRCFVSTELALMMGMETETPPPKTETEGGQPPAESSEDTRTMMQMDTLIRVTPNPKKAAAEMKK